MIKISSAIFKTFFLSLCIVANTHFAFAQTASILPPGYTQYLDSNGKPLSAGKVYNYIPSTTTPKTTWQDAAETIPNANPVILDAGGRAKILGDGSYRQIVKDRNNVTIWDAVTSSTGSGSSSPTATGDGDLVGTIKPWAGMTAPNQYAFTYGQEVSRTTYSSLYAAITSSQSVFCNSGSPTLNGLSDTTNFWIGMSVEVSCVAAGFSTVVSKTSSSVTLAANANVTTNTTAVFFPWGRGNGTTTFNLPDFRGFVIAGNDIMGGVSANRLPQLYFNSSGSVGSSGGNASQTLFSENLPPYTPTGTITNGAITSTFTGNQTALNFTAGGGGNFAAGAFATQTVSGSVVSTQAASTFVGSAAGGASTPFSIIQPTKTSNFIIKITPDANSATASGVTDIQAMTGSIACGTGLTCTGNIISASSSTYTPPYTGGVAETQTDYNSRRINVMDFGAKGDAVKLFDGAITIAGTTFTSATASFSSATDIGKLIRILGAGALGGILETTISSVTDANHVVVATPASATVTGASAFYGTNDTTAIQAAMNTMAVSANPRAYSCIYLPNRIFMTTASINISQFTNACIMGSGSSIVSDSLGSILQPSVGVNGITVSSSDPVTLENFGIFYASGANAATSAILFTPPVGQFNQNSYLKHVLIYNAYNAINTDRIVTSVIDSVEAFNFSNTAVIMQNNLVTDGLTGDAGDNKIVNSIFIAQSSAAAACVYWAGGGGLTVQNTKCSLANIGVQINPVAAVTTSQINIANNSFDGVALAGVHFTRQDGTSQINQLVVTGNTCNIYKATASFCVDVPLDVNGIGLTNLIVTDNTVYGPTVASSLFDINTVNNAIVSNNAIQSNNAGTTGIVIGSTVTNAALGANTFTGTFANDWTNASSSFKVANAIAPVTNGLIVSSSDRVSALATANNGVLVTSAGGVPSISSTLPAAVQGNITATGTITSGVWNGTDIGLSDGGTNASLTASNGGIVYSTATAFGILSGTATANLPLLSGSSTTPSWATISYPTSATSGGIPYFSSATAISSSAVLAANAIMVGGGAGVAPKTTGCTIDTNNSEVCSSTTAFAPQMNITNTTSDANAGQIQVSKSRSVGDTLTNDALGYFVFQGYANSGYRSTAVLQASQSAASSGSNIPSKITITTSNGAALQNHQMAFDHNAHSAVTLQATAPTLTAGCNGAGSSITGGGGVANDTHGTVVGQTAAATTCTLTFGVTYTNVPDCVFSGFQSPITVVNSVSTTGFQVSFASTANYKFSYVCHGN